MFLQNVSPIGFYNKKVSSCILLNIEDIGYMFLSAIILYFVLAAFTYVYVKIYKVKEVK